MSHINPHHRRAALNRRAPIPLSDFFPDDPIAGALTKGLNLPTGVLDPFPPTTARSRTTATTKTSTSTSATSESTSSSTSSSSTSTSTTSTSTSSSTSSSATTVLTTGKPTEVLVTTTKSISTTSSSPSASNTNLNSTSPPSTGLSTGAVVGGIAAGIVAIAAIGFAVAFFIRRSRKRNNDVTVFDSQQFRRSAMLLNDPPTHADTVARGFNPRPPPPIMTENRLVSPAPTFGTQYGHPGPTDYTYEDMSAINNRAGYGAGGVQSFAPGQYVDTNGGMSPMTATSAHPMFQPTGYNQSPFSPAIEQGQYPGQYQQATPQPAGVGAYPVLTRQSSQGSTHSTGPRMPEIRQESLPTDDYLDLSRSSVSPYQAAQYAEISKRLNAEVPEGLKTADIDHGVPPVPSKYVDAVSPFADPVPAPASPGGQYVVDRRPEDVSVRPMSGESTASQSLDFPTPPDPAHTASARYRIDSMPPKLPEIHVESRVSVGNYPGLREHELVVPGALSAGGSRFPTTPSPLASSFNMPASPFTPGEGNFAATAANMPAVPAPVAASSAAPATEARTHAPQTSMEKKRNTAYSMYDPDDAYGGF